MLHSANAELRRERLGRFLHRLAPVAAIFGLVEAWAASRYGDRVALRAALVALLYAGAVLVAARVAVRGATGFSSALASAGTLAAALLLVLIQPELYPALCLAPLLAAVIAYPYLSDRALVWNLGAALATTAAISVLGATRPATTRLPELFDLAFRAAATTSIAAFVAYFLWQYREQIESSLRGAEGRRAALERAIAELSGREREARRLALRDALTGVANRRLLLDRLEETLHGPRTDDRLAALLFVDLDGFKRINDELGHERGDRLLIEVARLFQATVRKTDTLARFGGDEFALLMPRVAARRDPEEVAQRFLNQLSRKLEPLPAGFRLSASVGLAVSPEHGTSPERMLRAADAAMYLAKLDGGGRFAWPGPDERATAVPADALGARERAAR